MGPSEFPFSVGLSGVAAMAGLVMWQRALKRMRLITGLPVARCRSAAQGYVQLTGTQHNPPGVTLIAPLTGLPCTWWRFRVEEYRRGSDDKSRWQTINEGSSSAPIVLRDSTGEVLVNPAGADVSAGAPDVWHGSEPWPAQPPDTRLRGGRYRYTELRMSPGDTLHAVGEFTTSSGALASRHVAPGMAEILSAWKEDQAGLLARFDSDRNGVIDAPEWEHARDAARVEVQARQATVPLDPPAPDADMLVDPDDDRPFLLSSLPMEQVTRRMALWSYAYLGAFLTGSLALMWLLQAS